MLHHTVCQRSVQMPRYKTNAPFFFFLRLPFYFHASAPWRYFQTRPWIPADPQFWGQVPLNSRQNFNAWGSALNVGTKLSIFFTKHLASSSKLSNHDCKPVVQIAITVANKVNLIKTQLF